MTFWWCWSIESIKLTNQLPLCAFLLSVVSAFAFAARRPDCRRQCAAAAETQRRAECTLYPVYTCNIHKTGRMRYTRIPKHTNKTDINKNSYRSCNKWLRLTWQLRQRRTTCSLLLVKSETYHHRNEEQNSSVVIQFMHDSNRTLEKLTLQHITRLQIN